MTNLKPRLVERCPGKSMGQLRHRRGDAISSIPSKVNSSCATAWYDTDVRGIF
ncbi:hypothetical protein K9B32_25275 [Rhizobium sp. 3T7]|uniref:hypothetical protein n=1 Tax=Rhizobium sp. 3T7 TaxID=2874922 RepID=UPI001CCA44E9|nr:hypothetical protein [Rhizobium sp. 3T7]MBZ9793381.1 hypothetical protein [Rhizobium sp. 3T7]